MNKHTPGPWTIVVRDSDQVDGPAQMGVIYGPATTQDPSNWVADVGCLANRQGSGSIYNAKLIAAAPELLFQLERLTAMLENDPRYSHWDTVDARKAIANARGAAA